tara:strand:+ start:590 stop:1474 length:885 start_codon:yes stop_codon:yes gene_type:complete
MNDKIFILEERGLLYISGEDVNEFLQNIVSNDIKKVSDENSIFASMLSPQGKYLFDFLIVKHKKGYFLDCNKNQIEKIYKQLDLYKIRSKVEITNLSNEFVVAVISKERFLKIPNSKNQVGFTLKFREDSIALDPRNKDLGARLIINLEKLYLTIKKLGMNIANNEEYYDLSHKLGIPQLNNIEMQNKVFGVECNFDELNAIDFKKGCYIGQENTSRIKLRNKLSKRLLPIKIIEGKLNIEDNILNNEKIIGKILINDKYPFGLVKIKEYKIDYLNSYKTKNALIKFIKPFWEN